MTTTILDGYRSASVTQLKSLIQFTFENPCALSTGIARDDMRSRWIMCYYLSLIKDQKTLERLYGQEMMVTVDRCREGSQCHPGELVLLPGPRSGIAGS